MNEKTITKTLSDRHGIDATDAVKDAIATWIEETGQVEGPQTDANWTNVEAIADAYSQDYLDTMVEDHREWCDDCESTKDVLAHEAE